MKLWGDVPWEGGPRKVIAVVTPRRLGAMLAFCGFPAETKHMCGRQTVRDVWTLLYPEELGKRVFGQGAETAIREQLATRGYRINWR